MSSSASRKQKSETAYPFCSCTREVPYGATSKGKRTGKENAIRVDLEDEVLAQEGIGLRREGRRPRPSRRRSRRGWLHGAAAVLACPLLFFLFSVRGLNRGGSRKKQPQIWLDVKIGGRREFVGATGDCKSEVLLPATEKNIFRIVFLVNPFALLPLPGVELPLHSKIYIISIFFKIYRFYCTL